MKSVYNDLKFTTKVKEITEASASVGLLLAMVVSGITEVTGSNSIEALIFFRLLLSNCLNWKIYCDDHSSL